jgi:zinc transporter ZupT
LGLHDHEGESDEHDHEEMKRNKNDPIWKMCVTLGTIFVLWMLDSFMPHNHDHVHMHGNESTHSLEHKKHSYNLKETEKANEFDSHETLNTNAIKVKLTDQSDNKETSLNTLSDYGCTNEGASVIVSTTNENQNVQDVAGEEKSKRKRKCKCKFSLKNLEQVESTGWMAFIGDILHKAADGFAIGASFAQSLSLGVSTSLAILFHEIPHELGDYAVLLGAGFEFWNILILNAFTSFVSLIAFFIIASVSPSELILEYIFAIVTGVFLFIAIANMVCLFRFMFNNKNTKINFEILFF